MKCQKCSNDLPDTAKFCPKCGTRQTPKEAPPAAAPAPAAPAPTTAAPAPAPAPAPAAAVAKPAPAPAAPAAAGGKGHAEALHPADFAAALEMVCQAKSKKKPDKVINTLDEYFAAGSAIGLTRGELDAAYHTVAAEKMQGKGASMTAQFFAAPRVNTIFDQQKIVVEVQKKDKVRAVVFGTVVVLLLICGGFIANYAYNKAAERKAHEIKLAEERTKAATRPASKPAPPKGTIDIDAFRAGVPGVADKVKVCGGAEIDPVKAGKAISIKVSSVIGLDGKATNIRILDDPTKSDAVKSCVLKEVGGFTFVAAQNAPVEIDFDLSYEPPAK